MILTPIPADTLPDALARMAAHLADRPQPLAALRRIAATWGDGVPVPDAADTPEQRADGVALAHAHGIGTLDEKPSASFMWDGHVIRAEVEATVIVHEVAHWLCAAPERRGLLEFGLGPGPETSRRAEARAQQTQTFQQCMHEEAQTSLLGILWEAELGHPAILAFLEQNWMEAWERPSTADWFAGHAAELFERGLIAADGRPATACAWADHRRADHRRLESAHD